MNKALLLGSLIFSGCGSASHIQSVLTIGDSITDGWNLPLSYMLRNEYNVQRVSLSADPSSGVDNCKNTTYTLAHIDQWLEWYPDNQIIIWNNGIWNVTVPEVNGDPSNYETSNVQYETEIIETAKKLIAKSPRVIFLTTTQLNPSDKRTDITPTTQLNDIAKRVLPPLGIEIHDLWDFTIDEPGWHISETNLHFSAGANEIIATWLMEIIKKQPVLKL